MTKSKHVHRWRLHTIKDGITYGRCDKCHTSRTWVEYEGWAPLKMKEKKVQISSD
jgi:hypothetical protein